MYHQRKVYHVLDLFGDFGGIIEVILIIAAFFINPISEQSFVMEAAKNLFYARSTDKKLMMKQSD